MENIKSFKKRLLELLNLELGIWLLGGTHQIKSIAVIPPLSNQLNQFSAYGVECLIYQKPVIKVVELIGGFAEEEFMRVSLTQYNTSKTLLNAQKLINLAFGNIQIQDKMQREVIVKTEKQIELEQASILIPNQDFSHPNIISNITEILGSFYEP